MTEPSPTSRVTARQIADLLAWARALSAQRPGDDPVEHAAFQRAKIELLSRIAEPEHPAGGGEA